MNLKLMKIFLFEIRRTGFKNIFRHFMYYRRWKDAQLPGRNSTSDMQPWITFASIDYLKDYIRPGYKVFEFGAGGSTLFFLSHNAEVFSTEHDAQWIHLLKEVRKQKLPESKWEGNLILPEYIGTPASPSDPLSWGTEDETYLLYRFEEYAKSINVFPDEHFDIVLVDGRSRPSCIMQSLSKVKSGGLLIVDNADREYYYENTLNPIRENYYPVLQYAGPAPYQTHFSRTDIWKRK